jgi:hypothetical protein
MNKILSSFLSVTLITTPIASTQAQMPLTYSVDPHLLNWIKANISPQTQLPYSFYIPQEFKQSVYAQMDQDGAMEGAIERLITEGGLDIYDGAVYQMVLTLAGGEENLKQAEIPLQHYWKGSVGETFTIRSGYPINQFIYDPKNLEAVSSDNLSFGQRGFIFRIIHADGKYLLTDPKNGFITMPGFPEEDRLHWLDWKPVAGENAWVVMAAMQLYHKKYFDRASRTYRHELNSVELRLSEEIARAAMLLQSEIGGIRMAPMNTYRNLSEQEKQIFTEKNWWYHNISTENNISWYGAFRMLYEATGKKEYQIAMNNIERYLNFVWDPQNHQFAQGAYYFNGKWSPTNEHFALDVQTWMIACLGPLVIDAWLGEGESFKIWKNAKAQSGVFDSHGQVIGLGYTQEHDRVSVEWSAGAILALDEIAKHYMDANEEWALEALNDKVAIRRHMQTLHYRVSETQSAYSYSSRRGWIPFGWNSHDPKVLSLASTGWMVFVDAGVNPFKFID